LVSFTVEFYDEMSAGQAELSSSYASRMHQALKGLVVPNRQSFITPWLWESEPACLNLFSFTNSLAVDYNLIKEPVDGQLALVDCGDGIRA
jgi:hypothetical protein